MRQDKVLTFRVRRLPLQINKAEATRLIQEVVGADEATVTVESLAVDLALSHTARSKTATVTIVPLPPCLEGEDESSFKASYAGSEYVIIFDRRFLGFTVLSDVDATEHILDGLSSHPFGSWQHRGHGPAFMWLRDGLPKDLRGVRTIIYGYDSQVAGSSSFQHLHDLSRNLINDLTSFGFGTSASTPIIFIAHSLGGLLLKETLISLAAYSDQQFSVIRNVISVINFGVPHKGMETSQLLTMVNGQPNAELVQDLTPRSSYLECIETLFNRFQHLRRFTVASFYETKTTKAVAVSSQPDRVIIFLLTNRKWDGKRWSRSGNEVVMVNRGSAIQQSSHPDEVYAVDEDHSSMVKFARDDVNYQRVLSYVRRRTLFERSENQVDAQNFGQKRALGFAGAPLEMRAPSAQHGGHEEPMHLNGRALDKRAYSHDEIIESLDSDIFKRRETEIAPNDPSTYAWVFRDNDLRLIHWLLKEEGVYWIHGKPGSGKSTLLKHIFFHPETSQALHQWSKSGMLIKAGFFFYYRGSTMQKSFYGLLRSILFQILSQVPRLCDEIPRHCLSKNRGLRIEWTLSDLQDTLRAIFRQKRRELNVCLFIDALDEFDGHLESLSEFIQNMITPNESTNFRAKVFFSSRPRDILFNQFKHFPSFQLQEHTKDDIERYTVERLKGFPGVFDQMESSQTTRQAVRRVVEYINQTADGVFLWVRLALDRLSQAVITQDAFTALDMNQCLREFPTELGDFYATIIHRMPQDFRWTAYLVLDTLLKALVEPSLQDLHLIVVHSKYQTIQECESRPIKPESFQNFCTQLREQCGGLIELEEPFREDGRVRLMHETVREFVSQPAFQELIVGREALFRSQNGYTELAKLEHYQRPGRIGKDTELAWGISVEMSAAYHYLAEITTGACQLRFIDSLGGRSLLMKYLPDDPLTFAVYYGLSLFVQEKLSKSADSNSHADKALLHAACLAANRFELDVDLGRYHKEFKPDHIRITQLLINKGLRMTTYKGTQPLANLLCHTERSMSHTVYLSRSPRLKKVAQLLLANGPDPNASSVLVGLEYMTSWICRPLHLSVSPMTEILLHYGADVNGRDKKGRTPIDVVIRRIARHPGYGYLPFLLAHSISSDMEVSTAVKTINVLAEKGGLITRAGLILLFEHLPKLSLWECAPRILKMIQSSLEEGAISSTDLWMARIVVGIRKSKRRVRGGSLRDTLWDEKDYC